jgi:hypothetical protein
MATTYTYSLLTYFQDGYNQDILKLSIYNVADLKPLLVSIDTPGTDALITFSTALSPAQVSELNAVVANFNPNLIIDNFTILVQKEALGVGGGDFIAGVWATRKLEHLPGAGKNTDLWVSITSNQFTLVAGNYLMGATCVVGNVGIHQLVLFDVTHNLPVIVGTTNSGASALIQGTFTTAPGGATYELRHRCTQTQLGTGMGIPGGFAEEVYATMRVTQV